MPFEITMPQLGLTMEVGTVVEWLIAEGDTFAEGQEILQVETDKAIMAVEAHQGGTLARILVPEGQEVPVGAALAVATAPGETLPAGWQPAAAQAPAPAQAAPARAQAAPAEGQAVAVHAAATAQATTGAAPAPSGPLQASWKARSLARQAGLDLRSLAGTGPGGRIVAGDVARALAAAPSAVEAMATPVAANLAAALGLELTSISGSGPQGRVTRSDVLSTAAAIIAGGGPAVPSRERAVPVPGLPQVAATIPLKGVRKIVSEGMAYSVHTTARVTLLREVDAGEFVRLRERYKDQGLDVSYNDLLIQICAIALREHPGANARLGDGVVEQLDRINIGLAVDTERGLLVPVVHNVGALSLRQIVAERERLIDEARTGRSHPDDLVGGTFTITNLGMLGVEGFTPVINLPECCILGVGRMVRKPVVIDNEDQVAVRPTMTLSLVFDHRVIDGAPAARFLDRIAQLVEEPLLLLTAE